MVKFKADLLSTQEEDLTEAAQEIKRQRWEHQKQQEEISMDSELQALTALQQGAHEVKTPVGADALRKVDLQQFRTFLKGKHEESGMTVSYDALASAQTTQAKAMEANQALDAVSRSQDGPEAPGSGLLLPLATGASTCMAGESVCPLQ